MHTTYIALLDRVNKRAPYGVCFPDFPGCISSGKTMDEALENARKGLIFHIESMREDGEAMPKPSSLEKIMRDPDNKSAIPAAIKIIVPTGQLRRLNISMDTSLINELDVAAKIAGRNRSEFLADAVRYLLS
jgi:predicted RNase H-like HicB family nuclease